ELVTEPVEKPAAPAWIIILLAASVAVVAVTIATNAPALTRWTLTATQQRGLLGLFILMVVMLLAAMVPRAADAAMETAIRTEHPHARRLALSEFAWLIPPILLGGVTVASVARFGWTTTTWVSLSPPLGPRAIAAIAVGGSALASMLFAAALG